MAASQVMGFVSVSCDGDMTVRTGDQLARMMLNGFDPSDSRLEYFGYVTLNFATLSEVDIAMDIARDGFAQWGTQ